MKKTNSTWMIVFAVMAPALLLGSQSSHSAATEERQTDDGLVRVETKAVGALYVRPGASLASYDKLLLRPVEVQFAKKPKAGTSSLYRMTAADREKVTSRLAQGFEDVFKQELGKGGYPLASEAAEDVLEVRAAIVNLYITAPDVSAPAGRSKVYTTDAGEMTLVMQLHDSITGELLARAYDRRGASRGMWTWTNSVTNSADARRIVTSWAGALRSALDASRTAAE